MAKVFIFMPEWQNFAKSGHSVRQVIAFRNVKRASLILRPTTSYSFVQLGACFIGLQCDQIWQNFESSW